MYILYVDESGDPTSATDQHYVLAGIAVFERQIYWLSKQLDALEVELFGAPSENDPIQRPVEFHATWMNSRKLAPWDSLTAERGKDTLNRLAGLIADCHETCALFGVVVHRKSVPREDPVLIAFNDLVSRFDLYLTRINSGGGEGHRGLMVFDKSRHEQRLQALLRSYTTEGGPFGRLRNFADVPFFADSRASRMLQLADFVAWATFRRYETSQSMFFDQIVGRYHAAGNRIHGLHHRTYNFASCYCPACFSRRAGTTTSTPA